jgi:predicted TIM-barrel fold metal-dependent hydrolase
LVIDCYDQLWRNTKRVEEFSAQDRTPAMILPEMDEAGVDRVVICSLGQSVDNAYIAECAEAYPDRFIPFVGVNPREDGAVETIHHYVGERGFRGLKLHPTMNAYSAVNHSLLDPIFAVCAEYRIPIYGHCWHEFWNVPLHWEEMARTFPDVTVIVGHLGMLWHADEAMMVAARTPNVYVETSGAMSLYVRDAVRLCGPEKVLMGTDWPAGDFVLERLKMERTIPDAAARRFVEGENMARLLESYRPAAMGRGRAAGR